MAEENMEREPVLEEKYEPRPRWQVWAARLGLACFLILLVIYYALMFKG